MDDQTIVDLNSLSPKPKKVKLDDRVIEVQPPSTANFIRLAGVGKRLSEIEKLTPDESEQVVNDLTEEIYRCIPDLRDTPLNMAQLQKLLDIIVNLGMPQDTEELKKRGVTRDSVKKSPQDLPGQ